MVAYAKQQATKYAGSFGSGPIAYATPGISVKPMLPTVNAAAGAAQSSAATPVEGVDYSGTNNQETGVDEPDMVKTNGTTLFAIENGTLNAVDLSGSSPKLLDSLPLSNGWSSQLLLSGTHLLVLSHGGYWLTPLPAEARAMFLPVPSSSVLTEIDVSDPSAMHVVNTLTMNGEYVDARMVGTSVRIVTSSSLPIALPLVSAAGGGVATAASAKAKNTKVIAASHVSAWLPTYQLGHGATHPIVQCRDIRRPVDFSGLGMLTVFTLDLAKGLDPVDSTAVMTDGRIVYASPTSLYVATERWAYRPLPAAPTIAPNGGVAGGVSTQISAFDISDPDKTTYTGSVTVPGYLLDQFSMSDFQGVLRVVSTSTPSWWASDGTSDSQSYLTTFTRQNGALQQAGQVAGLGQGERVYAVRMLGNDAYVETFRQVDPLYTIDVSDPTNPRVMGELSLPSYDAYLQPIGNDLLLGIGQDVDANGEPTGTQLSLFDVSNLAHPTQLSHLSLGQGWSQAESSSHAFLFWPPTSLVVVPFNQTAVGVKVSRAAGIQQLGTITQQTGSTAVLPGIDRSVVVGGSVLTVSSAGIESSSLSALVNQSFLAFPSAQPIPQPGPITPNTKSGGAKAGSSGASSGATSG